MPEVPLTSCAVVFLARATAFSYFRLSALILSREVPPSRSPTSHTICEGGYCHFCSYRRIFSPLELSLIVHCLHVLEAYLSVDRVPAIHCIRRNLFPLYTR